MSRLRTLALAGAALSLMAGAAAGAPYSGPFAQPSPLPLHAPQFDKYKDADYQPALEEGMRQQIAEMEAIANNPAPATFDNTIVAMEKSGQMLERVNNVFNGLTGANTNDALQKVESEEAPKFAAHHDAIYLNPKLYARVKAVYDRRASLTGPEQQMLVEQYYKDFVRAGAGLSDADKAKLRDLNSQLSTLSTDFQHKLLAAAKAGGLVVDDKAKLAGLSDEQVASLPPPPRIATCPASG